MDFKRGKKTEAYTVIKYKYYLFHTVREMGRKHEFMPNVIHVPERLFWSFQTSDTNEDGAVSCEHFRGQQQQSVHVF